MTTRSQAVRALVVAATWLTLTIGTAVAHSGHDHSTGMDTTSLWVGAASIVVLAALVYSMVRRRDPEPGSDLGERERLVNNDRDS